VNQIHDWVLHLETADGRPVEDARLSISGDMPAHGHGLPTAPEVSDNLGGGDYQVSGMKFQMAGSWEVYVDVQADGVSDRVVIPLELE
jgi:hypothetical protein